MRKLLLTTVIAAGLLAVAAGSAGAVDYPATTGTLTVTSSGDSGARVEGCGFAPGATVQIAVDGASATSTTANAEGCISTTITVSAGSRTVTATGLNPSGGTLTLTGTLSSSSDFAFTGANTGVLVGVAIAILGVGALFVIVTRRRLAAG